MTVESNANAVPSAEVVALEHIATGGGYDSVEIADVAVTVTDGDITVIPDVDSPVVTITADGSPTATVSWRDSRFTCRFTTTPSTNRKRSSAFLLEGMPQADPQFMLFVLPDGTPCGLSVMTDFPCRSTVTITDNDTVGVRVDPTAQTVTVTADADAEAVNDAVTLEHAAAGGGYDAVDIPDVAVTVADNDTVTGPIVEDRAAAIVLSPTSLELAEEDHAAYAVKLATQPTGPVTVTVRGDIGTDLTLDPTDLSFSADNWSAAQRVEVTAAADDDVENDEAILTHAAAGGGYSGVTARLTVMVTHNGEPGSEPEEPEEPEVDEEESGEPTTVPPANAAPKATDDTMETPADTPVVIDVLANDTDPDGDVLQVAVASSPAHGTVARVADGFRYLPDAEYVGRDRFAYTVTDGRNPGMTALVHVTVLPVNDAPTGVGAIPDQRLEEGGAPVTLDVALYFDDVDDAALVFAAEMSDPAPATVTVAGSALTLTASVTGAATVTVTARDAGGLTAAQTFGVYVGDRGMRAVAVDTLAALGRGYLSSVRSTLGRRLKSTGARSQAAVAGQRIPWKHASATGGACPAACCCSRSAAMAPAIVPAASNSALPSVRLTPRQGRRCR